MSDTPNKSYAQVLKSSALIGGSVTLNSGIQLVRTKAMALLLGPSGFGLIGLYWQLSEFVRSVAGMGINSSGVRQIAEAAGTGDARHIARTVTTLRRVSLVLGGTGALFLVLFSKLISRITFGNEKHAAAVALLGLAAMFGEISAAQGALLQGMRRIGDLARFNFLSALYGTVSSVAIIYWLGLRGVVPSLICLAATNILMSWWFARKVKVQHVSLSLRETAAEASELLKLGVAFMSSGLAELGAGYLVRIILLRTNGENDVGFYQAAWTLGGYYVGFILQAMAADFYPRITATANNHPECNRLVNEQAEVGVLIACPGMLATIALAPLAISLFYSPAFLPAVGVLRWICLGMVLRVVSWPMGFIILAKGLRNLFLWTELGIRAVYLGFVFAGVHLFQLTGVGIAFFGMYVVYAIGIYFVVRRKTGFHWSEANRKLALVFTPLVACVFAAPYILPPLWSMIFGAAISFAAGIYSLRTLCTLIPFERLPRLAQRFLKLLRLAPPAPSSMPLDEPLAAKAEAGLPQK